MKIGFYGHSTCAYRGESSFIDIVANSLNAEVVNVGTRMGSEERALLDLKKTQPNIAIVFHSQSRLIYAPNRKYDFDASSEWGLVHEEDIDMAHSYKTYFRDIELERSRLYGAAMQIEQFCQDTGIYLINCVDPKHPFPKWLKLSNVNNVPMTIARFNRCEFNEHFNGVTLKGNQLIAKDLISKIAARDGVVKRV